MRLKLILFLVLAGFVLAATAGLAHDTELIEWTFTTLDPETDWHEDEYPWKGFAFVYAFNSTNWAWTDFHFTIVGQDVTGVKIAADPAPTMSKPLSDYWTVIGTDANGNGKLDYYFINNPVVPGEGVSFTFYTDNTDNMNAVFGLCGVPTIPEPSSLLAMSGGLLGIAGYALRRRR